jgi:hypothetical protein
MERAAERTHTVPVTRLSLHSAAEAKTPPIVTDASEAAPEAEQREPGTASAMPGGGSILVRQHHGEDTRGHGLVCWIGRAVFQLAIVADPMEREAPNRVLS